MRFKAICQSKNIKDNNLGLGRRSESGVLDLKDDEAKRLEKTNMKHLLRYHFEDILGCRGGQ